MVPSVIKFIDVSQVKPKQRRQMTQGEKEEYRRRRLLKSCAKCTKQKRRCRHDTTATGPSRSSSSEDDLPSHDTGLGSGQSVNRSHFTVWDPKEPVQRHTDDYILKKSLATKAATRSRQSCSTNQAIQASWSHINRTLQGATGSYTELGPQMLNGAIWCGVLHTWFQLVPQRLGHSQCFDITMATLLTICNYHRGSDGAKLSDCYRALQSALPAIREATDSEEQRWDDLTLASIAAVYSCQPGKAEEKVISNPHLNGLMGMLTSRAQHGPTTEFAMMVCDFYICDTYLASCIRGIASPLEPVEWEYCQPEHSIRLSTSSGDLRAHGNKLSIRLPRLVLLVRAATAVDAETKVVVAALKSAEIFAQSFEYTVGRSLYPNVSVVDILQAKSPGEAWLQIVQPDPADLIARLHYWHTRIALLRMCIRLEKVSPDLCPWYRLPDTLSAEQELRRIYNDVLIALYFARVPWCYLQRRVFLQALLMCWGAMRSGDMASDLTESVVVEQSWLQAKMHDVLRPFIVVTLSEKDLDEAAGVFVGERVAGRFKELFD